MTRYITRADFKQPSDSCDPCDYQDITIEVMDAGGGHYAVVRTTRWALDLEDASWIGAACRKLIKAADEACKEE